MRVIINFVDLSSEVLHASLFGSVIIASRSFRTFPLDNSDPYAKDQNLTCEAGNQPFFLASRKFRC